jgi:zinc transport system ATP-binding protein
VYVKVVSGVDNRTYRRVEVHPDDGTVSPTRMLTSPVLQVRGLTVSFGTVPVLKDLGFEVVAGESLAIIGPTGAGKTVLFRALIGAVPYTGQIRWAPSTKVGYVPQKLDIERDLPITGHDLLRAKAHVADASNDEVRDVLDLVNLAPDTASKPLGTLSGGQFQRLLLAFAFLGRPNVLLFDEATAGVDEPGEEQLYERIDRLRQQRQLTLLLISHELSLVYRYATRVLCLGHGRTYLGTPIVVLTPERLEAIYGRPMKYHVHE